jgi:hypothetical protein
LAAGKTEKQIPLDLDCGSNCRNEISSEIRIDGR